MIGCLIALGIWMAIGVFAWALCASAGIFDKRFEEMRKKNDGKQGQRN